MNTDLLLKLESEDFYKIAIILATLSGAFLLASSIFAATATNFTTLYIGTILKFEEHPSLYENLTGEKFNMTSLVETTDNTKIFDSLYNIFSLLFLIGISLAIFSLLSLAAYFFDKGRPRLSLLIFLLCFGIALLVLLNLMKLLGS